jgi:hypothetical protein
MDARNILCMTCAVAAFALTSACDNAETGNNVGSTSTGERDERVGNDPADQNTGRGSNPSEEVASPGAEPRDP